MNNNISLNSTLTLSSTSRKVLAVGFLANLHIEGVATKPENERHRCYITRQQGHTESVRI